MAVVLECIVLFVVVLSASLCGVACRGRCRRTLRHSLRWVSRPRRAILSSGLLALLISVAATWAHAPVPAVHDEFSYLLAADTMAHGRLSNPQHPLWKHFESFHIIQAPTYASKYPPAQGAILAIGQVLADRPYVGLWLSTALAAGIVCWMLQGWLPQRWAFIGAMLIVLNGTIELMWGQIYWGGTVALAGGALLLGALPRLQQESCAKWTIILVLGAVVLANSRPFEGGILAFSVALTLILRLVGKDGPGFATIVRSVVAPAAVILIPATAMMLAYNESITGNLLQMPFQLHEATYSATPLFLWQDPPVVPPYRVEVMRRFYVERVLSDFVRQQSVAGFVHVKGTELLRIWLQSIGLSLTPALLLLPLVVRTQKFAWAAGLLLVSLTASLMVTWLKPHYLAPVVPLLLLLLLQGFRHLHALPVFRGTVGRKLVPVLLVTYCLTFAARFAIFVAAPLQTWGHTRAAIVAELHDSPGNDLVVVRYASDHDPHQEWVYNAADIDAAPIVWARELSPSENLALLEYFGNRTQWLLLADENPPRLLRQPAGNGPPASRLIK